MPAVRCGRQSQGQLRIGYSQHRNQVRAEDHGLAVGGGDGDHGGARHFAPGSRGGGDGDIGRHIRRDAICAVQQIVVFGQRQFVRDFQPDGFGGIQGRSAAQADDPVATVLLVDGQAVEHVALGGVRVHCGEDRRAGTRLATRSKTGVRARPASVTSSGREMPRLLSSSGRRCDRARAEQDGGGEAEGGHGHNHHESIFC